jgi:hypothetical protein
MFTENSKEILGYLALLLGVVVIVVGTVVAVYQIVKWCRMMKEHEAWEKEFKKEWYRENLK